MIDEVNEVLEVSQDVQYCINSAIKNRGSDKAEIVNKKIKDLIGKADNDKFMGENPEFDFAMVYILSHVFMKELNILGFKLWVSRAE